MGNILFIVKIYFSCAQGAREEIGEMMVKILREGAQLGNLRRQRGIGSEKKAWLRLDSGARVVGRDAAGLKRSQWEPAGGSFAFEESGKMSERRPEREGRRQYRSPWVKSRIW